MGRFINGFGHMKTFKGIVFLGVNHVFLEGHGDGP
jgi:hypothetical protein